FAPSLPRGLRPGPRAAGGLARRASMGGSRVRDAPRARLQSAVPSAGDHPSDQDRTVSDLPPSPARTTTTLFSYAERLAAEQEPRAAALRLGLRWSFGLPASSLEAIPEYGLPLNPEPILAALER